MLLPELKSKLATVIALSGLAALGLVGCSADSGSSIPSDPEPADSRPQAIGVGTGTFRNGHLELGLVTAVDGTAAPGLETESFGRQITQTKFTFDTPSDGVQTGSCSASQYCAQISLTNGTNLTMDNTFVEVTDYSYITPNGATVTWAGSAFPLTTTYASAFVNSSNVAAASYGSMTAGQTKTVEWKWDIGTATYFDFHFKVYGSFARVDINGAAQNNASAVDACAISGHNTIFVAADDGEQTVSLPFAYTLQDLTYDKAVISSNGYVLFYSTGGTIPSLDQNNLGLNGGGVPGLFPFWDDLAYDAGDGVCFAVTGTTPNRFWTVTWKNAKISTSQPSKGTWTTEKVTYSLVLQESNDFTTFAYNLPSGGVTNITRGQTATIGYRGQHLPYRFGANLSFNKPYANLSATSAGYTTKIFLGMTPGNP